MRWRANMGGLVLTAYPVYAYTSQVSLALPGKGASHADDMCSGAEAGEFECCCTVLPIL